MQGITQEFRDILRGFKMTVDFNKLIFAFVGIVFSIIWVLVVLGLLSALGLISTSPFAIIDKVLVSPRLGLCHLFSAFLSGMATLDWAEYLGLVVLVVGLLIIWSIIGGAITRLAALEFARDEKIGFKEALSFASKKFWSYFWSPITPALGVLFFVACNIIGGLFGQIKYIGEIAVAIGFPLAILSGFLIVFIGIIGAIGFFLMFPTISAEGSDAFDAMSRAYSYVISKPKHFISLFLGIIICGTVFTLFVSLAACLIMQTSFYTVGFGMGEKFESIKAVVSGGAFGKAPMASLGLLSMKFTALMLMIYIVLIKVAVGSLVVAFAGSASTIAYFLLRKDVDGTDINDVYIEEKEGEEEKREEEKEETKVETEEVETTAKEEEETAQEEQTAQEEETTQEEETKEKPPEEPGESSPEEKT